MKAAGTCAARARGIEVINGALTTTAAFDGTLLVGSVVLLHLGSDANSDVIDTLAWQSPS